MDKLLFGNNQFFGVNHMSEEKARAQAMLLSRHSGLSTMCSTLPTAEGIRTFFCTTHDRVAEIGESCAATIASVTRISSFTLACRMPTNMPTPPLKMEFLEP